jgi:hypothetical protein
MNEFIDSTEGEFFDRAGFSVTNVLALSEDICDFFGGDSPCCCCCTCSC